MTTRRDARNRPAADLVNRSFAAEEANRLRVADVTHVPTWAGIIFLAIVVDVWSRRIVGWAIGESMRTELVLAALSMALTTRKPQKVIHHSDQGSQYTSIAFGTRCVEMGVKPSMGSVGDGYDNAMAESVFASLECEIIDRRSFKTKTDAHLAVFSRIQAGYNTRRRHSALRRISPHEFERRHDASLTNSTAPLCGLPTAGACVAVATPAVDNPTLHDC